MNDEFEENNRFLREIFNRKCELTDELIDFYQQIEQGDKQIYEYRLDILKFDFEKDKNDLKNLFVNQHLKELDHEIDVLISLEHEDSFQQSIQFQLQKKQINEIFFRNLDILREDYLSQIDDWNRPQTSSVSKLCRQLIDKTRLNNEKIDKHSKSIEILKRKIGQTKTSIEHHEEKQRSNQQLNSSSTKKSTDAQVRRLVSLTDRIEKECRRKLDKAHRLFSLIHQCEKLELENEKVLFSSLKTDSNQLNFLSDCHLQIDDSFADQLTLFWKRFAHVQLDLFSRIKQKKSNLEKANQLFQLTKYESGVVSSR